MRFKTEFSPTQHTLPWPDDSSKDRNQLVSFANTIRQQMQAHRAPVAKYLQIPATEIDFYAFGTAAQVLKVPDNQGFLFANDFWDIPAQENDNGLNLFVIKVEPLVASPDKILGTILLKRKYRNELGDPNYRYVVGSTFIATKPSWLDT